MSNKIVKVRVRFVKHRGEVFAVIRDVWDEKKGKWIKDIPYNLQSVRGTYCRHLLRACRTALRGGVRLHEETPSSIAGGVPPATQGALRARWV